VIIMAKTHLTLLLAATVVLRAAPAGAQPTPTPTPTTPTTPTTDKVVGEDDGLYNCKKIKSGEVTVSLKPETELKDLITWVMGFTCKNFIYEPGLIQRSKKVTVISPNKMSPQEAYRLFLVALSTMGVTVVPKGNSLRIVESGQAKGETVPIRKGAPANTDEFVRFVFRPSYMTADTMTNALNVLKSKDGAVNQVGNVVLVTDYASQIRDMITLAKELDKPSANEGIYTILVQYADAKELQTKLQEILGVAGGTGAPAGKGAAGDPAGAANTATPSKILVDDRTNTLIVVSTEAGYLRVRALVKRLDLPLETAGTGSIHVYPLENATAEEMANTLNSALQGSAQPTTNRTGQPATGGRPATRDGVTPAGGGTNPVRGDLGAALEGTVRVTHDAPTNSLVVVASGRDFIALKDVIRKLDVPRQQVYLEAVILEVQLGDEMRIGTSSHGGLPIDGGNGIVLGGVQTPDLRSTNLSTLLSASGLIGGLIGAPLAESERLLGVSVPSYAVLFQALATSANTNVLSTPFIMATDNQESEISVGQNIPYQAGLSFGGIGLPGQAGQGLPGSIGQNIQREKLTLSMKIKPHINQSDMVRLEIEQEIKDIGDKDPQLGPTWTERKVKTQVVVRDQQSIVIGGLMQDRTIYNEAKVPLLGDIPILGYLFKYTSKSKKKTNLLILLTPYVVKDQLDLEAILERKARERNEFVRAFANLDSSKYLPTVDYTRKRGLVEEINRTIEGIEQDTAILHSLEGTPPPPDGVIDIGPGDGYGDEPTPGTVPAPTTGPTTAPTTPLPPPSGANVPP
jgi:general secretion pathway protein D